MEAEKRRHPSHWPITALVPIFLLLLMSGIWFYRVQEASMRHKVEDELLSIARLKVEQLVNWRQDQLNDAAAFQKHPFLVDSTARFMAERTAENRRDILLLFRSLARQHDYSDILLIDKKRKVLLSLNAPVDHYHGYISALAEAKRSRQPVFTEMHRESSDSPPHISVVAPFYEGEDKEYPIAVLVLVNDASQFLYPLIQFWPSASKTAETLIVKRDRDDVLFLNNLRHESDVALKHRIPLSQKDLPAAMAIHGKKGIVYGRDYRGVKVVAAIMPVLDSPWFMVSKMDTSEAFAEWRFRSFLLLALLFGSLAFLGSIGFYLRQREKKAHFRSLYKSEAALRATTERQSITLKSIGDAVIATDAKGRVELLNPVAEALTGWAEEDARGKFLEEIFNIINEETRQKVENPVARVLREGVVVGLANHTLLISRDGREIPIADSGAPIRDENGAIVGVVLIFRDISAEYAAAETLRQSEEKFFKAFQTSPYAITITRARDGKLIEVNDAFYSLSGYSREESLNGSTVEMDLWANIKDRDEVVAALRAGESVKDREFRFRRKNGEEIICSFSAQIIVIKGETCVLSSINNITDRKTAEDKLKERERELSLITDNMRDTVWLMDLEFRTYWISPSVARARGYTLEELSEMPIDQHFTPESLTRVIELIAANLTPERLADPDCTITVSEELEYCHKDGSTFWAESDFTLLRDSEGKPFAYLGVARDVTERRRAEEALRENERRFRELAEMLPEAVFEADQALELTFVNPKALEFFGYSPEDLQRGLNGLDMLAPKERYRARENIARRLRDEMDQAVEYTGLRKDGSTFPLLLHAVPVTREGAVVGFRGVIVDMSKQKQESMERARLEERFHQMQKLESIGRLAGGVAHDLNNLLTPILGYGEILLEDTPTIDPRRESLVEIMSAAERARALVRQLLAFSRKQALEFKQVNLNDLLKNFERLLRRTIREDISLNIFPAPSLPFIKGDVGQLEQVVMNLAINAQDAMPNGGELVIETSVTELDEQYATTHEGVTPGAYVMLMVSDTGSGMKPEAIEHLFEPFFTTKDKEGGTGLGLATVYGIVKQHGGNIWAYSEAGMGTIFKVYLPVSSYVAEGEKKAAPRVYPARLEGAETILLVEDYARVRDLARVILKQKGYQVLVAASGKEALESLAKHKGQVHLLLTDVVMPEMNGKELFEIVSSKYPGIKVIYMSGYTDNVIAQHGVLEDGVNFIQKPFSVNALAAKVREVLDF